MEFFFDQQYGSGKTMGAHGSGGEFPSYVYPSIMKAVVRARYPDAIRDWVDLEGPRVSLGMERGHTCT